MNSRTFLQLKGRRVQGVDWVFLRGFLSDWLAQRFGLNVTSGPSSTRCPKLENECLESGQCLGEIGNEIIKVLNAHAEPNETVRRFQGRTGGGEMRHYRGQLDEALHSAQ